MKKLTIFLIFFISISVFSVLSCSNTDEEIFRIVNALIGPEGGTVTSSEGKLTLDIPPGALDEVTEISIRKINPNDLPPEFEGIDADLAYLLEPDGLEFNIPIDVELITDQKALDEDGNISAISGVLITSLDGKIELLNNLQTIIDADSNTVTELGQLEHFSPMLYEAGLPLISAGTNIAIDVFIFGVSRTVEINEKFDVSVVVEGTGRDIGDRLREFSGSYKDCSTPRIFSLGPLEVDLSPEVASNIGIGSAFPIELAADFEYSCISEIETSGVFCADIKYLVRYDVDPSFANSPSHDNEFVINKTVRLEELILCVEELLPTPTPTPPPPPLEPTPTPTPTPSPAPNVTCADVSQIEFDAIIESLAGQTNQAPFITPNACDISRVTITNNNMGGTVTDDVPDGSGGGISTLVDESGIPFFTPVIPSGPEGQVCGFSAFGRDNIAGGNDVGTLAIGEFVITPQGNVVFRFFQVSYGIDTLVQDWFGGPFIVNCEPDPQGEFIVVITPF